MFLGGIKMISNDNARCLVHKFIDTDRAHHRIVDKFTDFSGLHRSQHILLMHLSRCEVMPSQKELAEHLRISPTAVAVKIKKLETDGFIKRNQNSKDCRTNFVSITEKGREIVEKTQKIFKFIDLKMVEGLSEEEINILMRSFDKMQENLKNLEEYGIRGGKNYEMD